jgi:hypothetical protein
VKKLPYITFYAGDWLKDPLLSICTPATRGVWIDLLCAMHESGRSGELRGTGDQIARLARCSTAELAQALTELQTTGAAVVENRNDSWLIANRRMRREAETREKRVAAGSKGGSIRQANREQKPEYENEDEGLRKVREFCKSEGITSGDADFLFWKWHANDWTNSGEQIRDWKATVRSWQRAGYLPSQKNGGRLPSPKMGPSAPREIPERYRSFLLEKYPAKRDQIATWKTWEQLPAALQGDWQEFKKGQQ